MGLKCRGTVILLQLGGYIGVVLYAPENHCDRTDGDLVPARGAPDSTPALAVMLGADLCSILIIQILALDITSAVPFLVLVGVGPSCSCGNGRPKNLGRWASARCRAA
jgi:hypothetical protein